MLAAASQKLIRRHDRIRAVWQRTPSLNTARRCELRLSALAAEARTLSRHLNGTKIAAHNHTAHLEAML